MLRRLTYLPWRRTFLVRVRDAFFLVSAPESVAREEIFLVVSLIRLDAAPFRCVGEEIFLVAEPFNLDAREIFLVTSPFCLDAAPFWFARESLSCAVSPKKLASGAILLVASPLLVAITPMHSPRLRGEGARRADEGRAEAWHCLITKHPHMRLHGFPTLDASRNTIHRGSVCPSPAFGTLSPRAGRGNVQSTSHEHLRSLRARRGGVTSAHPAPESVQAR